MLIIEGKGAWILNFVQVNDPPTCLALIGWAIYLRRYCQRNLCVSGSKAAERDDRHVGSDGVTAFGFLSRAPHCVCQWLCGDAVVDVEAMEFRYDFPIVVDDYDEPAGVDIWETEMNDFVVWYIVPGTTRQLVKTSFTQIFPPWARLRNEMPHVTCHWHLNVLG